MPYQLVEAIKKRCWSSWRNIESVIPVKTGIHYVIILQSEFCIECGMTAETEKRTHFDKLNDQVRFNI